MNPVLLTGKKTEPLAICYSTDHVNIAQFL